MARIVEIERCGKRFSGCRSSLAGAQPSERPSLPKPMGAALVHRIVGMRDQTRLLVLFLLMCAGQTWAYSGGTGALQVPYLIATAEDLIQLGQTSSDYDRHFLLVANIDLSEYIFDRAVIAPESSSSYSAVLHGRAFSGSIDGNGHVIQNLRVTGSRNLGLIGVLSPGA